MTPERAAHIAADTRSIAETLEGYGVPNPHEKADQLVRWLQSRGWRYVPAVADVPPPRPASAKRTPAQEAAIKQIREVFEARGRK